jgi:hypothetical protein
LLVKVHGVDALNNILLNGMTKSEGSPSFPFQGTFSEHFGNYQATSYEILRYFLLLIKVDGVDALNNILLIGMTKSEGSPSFPFQGTFSEHLGNYQATLYEIFRYFLLLIKVDGVDALNNILLIGMTNRKDLLDEALLRPGRFVTADTV